MIDFVGAGVRLTSADIAKSALELGCESAVLLAIMEAESNVKGFDTRLRPKILFEQYVFYKRVPISLRATALRAGLAVAKSSDVTYAHTSDANYARLMAAIKIDEASALEACSWGIGQVLGENYKSVGFSSAEDLALSAVESEQNQLAMMVAFLKANNLVSALIAKNWQSIARTYNGPNYKKYQYDTKLSTYYTKWKSRGGILPARTLNNTAPNDAHRIATTPTSPTPSDTAKSGGGDMLALAGYKTYIVAALTVLYAVIGIALHYITGNDTIGITWQTGINLIIAALFGTTFRSAMKTQTGGLGSMLATVGEQISTALGDVTTPATAAAETSRLHPDDISTIVNNVAAKLKPPGQ